MSFIPGIYTSNDSIPIVLMDINSLNLTGDILNSREIIQFIDISPNYADTFPNELEVRYNLRESVNWSVNYKDFQMATFGWDFSFFFGISHNVGIYYTLYLVFFFCGILMSFGIAVMIISIQKENRYFNGILLARGYGRANIIKMIMTELGIVLGISLIPSFLIGFFFSVIFISLRPEFIPQLSFVHLPISFNYIDFFFVLSMLIVLSVALSLLSFKMQSKKKIQEFLHKF